MLQFWQAHCKHWNKLSGPPADSKIVLMTSSAWRGSELLPVLSTTPVKGALDKASGTTLDLPGSLNILFDSHQSEGPHKSEIVCY